MEEIKEKLCTKCKQIKLLNLFPKNKTKKYGVDSACKECMKISSRRYRAENYDCCLQRSRQWKRDHRKECLAYNDSWNRTNAERKRESDREWVKNNPEKIKQTQKRFAKNHPDRMRAWTRKTSAKLRSTPSGRLKRNMGTAMCLCLKGQKAGKHWECLVGYTIDDLKFHLEKQFKNGMSWDNYGRGGWEVDHKYPIALFDFNDPKQIKKCWALDNLQPLWHLENKSKGKKVIVND